MQINKIKPSIEDVYFSHNFIVMIDSHLTYLRADPDNTLASVTKHQNYKYEGDLYGLLNDLNISKKYHFIIARLNGYESSVDFKGDVEFLTIPNLSQIDLLKNIFLTKNSF